MRLTIQDKGTIRHHGKNHGKGKTIDFTGERFLFYDESGSIVFDLKKGWFKDGKPFVPTFPFSITLDDGRTVKIDLAGGVPSWKVQ